MPKTEIILRDFDGTRTVYKTETPLRNLISTTQSELEITISKTYVRTEETDDSGRIIYKEHK